MRTIKSSCWIDWATYYPEATESSANFEHGYANAGGILATLG